MLKCTVRRRNDGYVRVFLLNMLVIASKCAGIDVAANCTFDQPEKFAERATKPVHYVMAVDESELIDNLDA